MCFRCHCGVTHISNSINTVLIKIAILSSKGITCYRGQPKAGTGYKMLSVPFVFSMSRFQGPAFRCDKIVVIVTFVQHDLETKITIIVISKLTLK